MSRILLTTQLVAIVSLWLVGLSPLQVVCLSTVATLVIAIATIAVWIWQDQHLTSSPLRRIRLVLIT